MMCEEMIFEYWFSTIRKLSARKKYLLRELIGSGKKIYYIEETEITGIEFLTEEEKEGLKKARKEKTKEQLKEEFTKCRNMESNLFHFFQKNILRGWLRYQIHRLLFCERNVSGSQEEGSNCRSKGL